MEAKDVASKWRELFARQAVSDFEVYAVLTEKSGLPNCHRLHYLQMALEKSAKAHFWGGPGAGSRSSKEARIHDVAEKYLPRVFERYWMEKNGRKRIPGGTMKAVKALCREADRLAPAVHDEERRRDNCEYPWEVVDHSGIVSDLRSPLDHEFAVEELVRNPRCFGFLKAVRASVEAICERE